MKILRLDLIAFGPFTETSLAFHGHTPGFHLVYGRNEAGKSSALRALRHIRLLSHLRVKVLLTPEESPAANYAFDVTPGRLVTGLITERGICDASEAGILDLFPEKKQ